MKDMLFFDNFIFTEFCFNSFRHNEFSKGIAHHYIAYMREGHCRIVSGKQSFTVREGEFFYLPKNFKYHSYWYLGECGVVRFNSYAFKHMPKIASVNYPAQTIPAFSKAVELNEKLAKNRNVNLQSVGIFYQLLGTLINEMDFVPESRQNIIVERAENYMRENIKSDVPDIAKHCQTSQTYLYNAFRSVRGHTPVQAKHKIVVEMACELLATTNMSIEEISDNLGFGTSAYFRKIFFKEAKMTPRQFRKNRIFETES